MQSRKVPVPPAPPKKNKSSGRGRGVDSLSSAPSSRASSLTASPAKEEMQTLLLQREQQLPGGAAINSASSSFSGRSLGTTAVNGLTAVGGTTTLEERGRNGSSRGVASSDSASASQQQLLSSGPPGAGGSSTSGCVSFDPGSFIARSPSKTTSGNDRGVQNSTTEENRAFAAGARAALANEASHRGERGSGVDEADHGHLGHTTTSFTAVPPAHSGVVSDSSTVTANQASDSSAGPRSSGNVEPSVVRVVEPQRGTYPPPLPPSISSASLPRNGPQASIPTTAVVSGSGGGAFPTGASNDGPGPSNKYIPQAQAQSQEQGQSSFLGETHAQAQAQAQARPPVTVQTAQPSVQAQPLEKEATPPTSSSSSSSSTRLPQDFPSPLLPVDYFMNAAATRICFDLVRNPAFAEHIRARVQRQLSRMHTPSYVQTLEVISVEPGTSAPSLKNFAALPQPGDAVWPQLIYDVKYQGSFTVTIECKVDIRDGPAWSAIGQAINRIEGKVTKKLQRINAGIDQTSGSAEESDGGSDWESSDEERLIQRAEKPGNGGGGTSPGLGSIFRGGTSSAHHTSGGDSGGASGGGSPAVAASAHSGVGGTSAHHSGASGGSGSGSSNGPSNVAAHPDVEHTVIEEEDLSPESPQLRRHLIGQIRHHAAQKLRKLAETTAMHISNLPLRVSLTFSEIEATMCVWIPPPPGNRLFWSFLSPPKLTLKATPQLGTRLLKYAYHASRASAWIQARMELAFRKNLVFPCGGDVPLPLLLPSWDPRASDSLPGLDLDSGTGQQNKDKKLSKGESKVRPDSSSKKPDSNSTAPFIEIHVRRPQQ